MPSTTFYLRGKRQGEMGTLLALESSCAPQKQGKDLDFLLLLRTLPVNFPFAGQPFKANGTYMNNSKFFLCF